MKKIVIVGGLIIVALVAFCLAHYGYNTVMESQFANKQYWAVCYENEGMVTSEMYLYDDSTFYAVVLNEPTWGTYQIQDAMMHLEVEKGNKAAFCDFYKFEDPAADGSAKLVPVGNCGVDFMLLYYKSGKGVAL